MKKFFQYQSWSPDLATLLIRLLLGGLFVYIGYLKLDAYNQIIPQFGDPIGIGTKLSLNLVIFAELGCGFLVLIGFLTRLALIPLIILMTVVYFVAHKNDAFVMKQTPLFYYVLCFVLMITGAGKYSVDRAVFKRN